MKNFLSLFLCFVFILILLPSCASNKDDPGSTAASSTTASYEMLIKALEKEIADIKKDQQLSENESNEKIEELLAKIEELKQQASTTQVTTQATTTHARSVFIYSIENGKAIITGFTGKEESLVIPSEIDGFPVYSISSNAFEDYSIKSVIISEGVEKIEWFAFYNCESLQSVTIPSSVRRIGYSAFDGCHKSFTIYCHSDSFALSYAQSYGLTYAII